MITCILKLVSTQHQIYKDKGTRKLTTTTEESDTTTSQGDTTVLPLARIILAAIVVKCKCYAVTATTAEDSRFSLRVGGHSCNQNSLNFIMRHKANRISSLLRDLFVERARERGREKIILQTQAQILIREPPTHAPVILQES